MRITRIARTCAILIPLACTEVTGPDGGEPLPDNLTGGTLNVRRVEIPAGKQHTVTGNVVVIAEEDIIIHGTILIAPGGSLGLAAGDSVLVSGSIGGAPAAVVQTAHMAADSGAHAAAATRTDVTAHATAMSTVHIVGDIVLLEPGGELRDVASIALRGNATRLQIGGDVFGKNGAASTARGVAGEDGADVEIGTEVADAFWATKEITDLRAPLLVRITGRVHAGHGGRGFNDVPGVLAGRTLDLTGSDGGPGGDIRIRGGEIEIFDVALAPGNGGDAGGCGVLSGPDPRAVRGANGAARAEAGVSVACVTGDGGLPGSAFVNGNPVSSVVQPVMGLHGEVWAGGGDGGPGGSGGSVEIRVGTGRADARLVKIEGGANGGPAGDADIAGGTGGTIIVLTKDGSRVATSIVFASAVANGGNGFNACQASPFVRGSRGGDAGGLVIAGASYELEHGSSFNGGLGGNGRDPATGGLAGLDDAGNLLGGNGPQGTPCGHKLAFVQIPTAATANAVMSPHVKVALQDANGATLADDATSVTLNFGTNTVGGVLLGDKTVTAQAGVATFTNVSVDRAGDYNFTAAAPYVATVTSAVFEVLTDHRLVFEEQPTAARPNALITPPVKVAIKDGSGNTLSGDITSQVILSLGSNAAAATLQGTTEAAVQGGVATFSDLSVSGPGTFTLAASVQGLPQASSGEFEILDHVLVFARQPETATRSATMAPVEAAIKDGSGNVVSTDNSTQITIDFGNNPGGGVLSGTKTRTAASGVVVFNDLIPSEAGAGNTFVVTAPSLPQATSALFDVQKDLKLAFVQVSASVTISATMDPVEVAVQDLTGTIASTDNETQVTVAIGSLSGGGTLAGTKTQTVSAGKARFTDLSIGNHPGTYNLVAVSPLIPLTEGPAFDVTSDMKLAFVTEPTLVTRTATMAAVEVAVQNSDGSTNTVDNSTQITVALGNNTGGGELLGTKTLTVSEGVVRFTGLSMTAAGTAHTLVASAPSLQQATSGSFDVQRDVQLAFVQVSASVTISATMDPVEVAVQDLTGTIASTDNETQVTVAIGSLSGGGTLAGTKTQTVSAGKARFTDLSIGNHPGTYNLVAVSPLIPLTEGPAFDVTSDMKLAFVTEPTLVTRTATMAAVEVAVQNSDGSTNTVDNSTQITVALGNNTGGGELLGTKTLTVSEGVVRFTGLSMTAAGTAHTLVASAPSLQQATSGSFDVQRDVQLAFVQVPASVTISATMDPVEVAVQDLAGATIGTDNSTAVTIAIGNISGGGELSGTKTITASDGIARFTDLSFNQQGTYNFVVNSPLVPAATSQEVEVRASDMNLAFVLQPKSVTQSATMAAFEVAVKDGTGGTQTGDNSTVITLDFGNNAGGGVLSGTKSRTASGGIARFTDVSVDQPGANYTFTAAAPSHTSATSAAFDVLRSDKLAFVQMPSNATANAVLSPAVKVAIRDAAGATLSSDNSTQLTLGLGLNPGGGALAGSRTVTVQSGVATYQDLVIDKAGSYSFSVSGPLLATATSNTFTVFSENKLVYVQQPTTVTLAAFISPAVEVAIQDPGGATLTGDNTTQVTIAFGTNAGSGTLSGTKTVMVQSGVARFPDLSINKLAAGYTLRSSAAFMQAVTSNPFDVVLLFETLAAGGHHACALDGQGGAYCWGVNAYGALGDNSTSNRNRPVAVQGGHRFVKLTAGEYHTCGITVGGGTKCWGSNFVGELGDGTTTPSSVPVDVHGGHAFTDIDAGFSHTCGVLADGKLRCWGHNSEGQLGNGTKTATSTPTLVLSDLSFALVDGGGNHTCALTGDGSAACWGYNFSGQLGIGTSGTGTATLTPAMVSGSLTFADLEVGRDHACALVDGGALYCWGRGEYGRLGDGATDDRSQPTRSASSLTVAEFEAGDLQTCVVTSDGAAYCFGGNFSGQLGNGTTDPTSTPVAVSGGRSYLSVRTAVNHSCALASDKVAWCFGAGPSGQMGDGTFNGSSTPVQVKP
ncbi:MAG: hypothetical protein WD801_10875 [Gemmatimonadaceae bacterium]